ncbi:hypothetical protein IU397_20330 [Actibacterium sp. 188UL27-1]|nr:hypothetical protein [Actibacterium sp. 188UL27-1]
MVQAIERVEDPFALGVPWHPEYLFNRRPHRAVFRVSAPAAWALWQRTLSDQSHRSRRLIRVIRYLRSRRAAAGDNLSACRDRGAPENRGVLLGV